MMSKQDFLIFIKARAALSTWKPNFDDAEVADSWYEELKHFPFDVFRKVLKKLGGQKQFPSVTDIVSCCQSEMKPPPTPQDGITSSAEYLKSRGKQPLSNDQKKAFNADKQRKKARQDILYPLFRCNEMEYLKKYYPLDWVTINDELANLSYFPEMTSILESWLLNPTVMIKEIMPSKKFDWTKTFNVKFD